MSLERRGTQVTNMAAVDSLGLRWCRTRGEGVNREPHELTSGRLRKQAPKQDLTSERGPRVGGVDEFGAGPVLSVRCCLALWGKIRSK